jgi:hypothetical protein
MGSFALILNHRARPRIIIPGLVTIIGRQAYCGIVRDGYILPEVRRRIHMKQFGRLFLFGTILAAANAGTLLDVTTTISGNGESTQTGRLSRNGIVQDWSGTEPFPGVINTAITYAYTTFSVAVGSFPFIEIDYSGASGNDFFSAYDTSYNPDSAGAPNFGFNVNWLGDAGASNSTGFFRVVIPTGHNLVVVANTVFAGVGDTDSFHLTVQGFTSAVPEPASFCLVGTALLLLTTSLRRSVASRRRR